MFSFKGLSESEVQASRREHGSNQISPQEAVRNAGAFIAEGAADAIKLEGGRRVCPQIKAISEAIANQETIQVPPSLRTTRPCYVLEVKGLSRGRAEGSKAPLS